MAGADFLSVLGGVGKGVLIGSDAIRQQEAHDANLQSQQALQAQRAKLLEQQTQQHEWKADAVKRLQAEQEKGDTLQTLTNRVNAPEAYGDEPAYARQKRVMDAASGMNLYTPEQRKAAEEAYNGLVKTFGVGAYDAALRGDVAPLKGVFQSKGLGDIDFDGKDTFTIKGADGSASTLSRTGLMQLPVMSGVYERALAASKADLERREKESVIGKNNRQYGIVQNPDGSMSYMGKPGAGKGSSGSGSKPGGGDAEPTWRDALGFKDQKDLQAWIGNVIPDEGVAFKDASGADAKAEKADLLRDTESNLAMLMGGNANRGLDPHIAREIALNVALAKRGKAGDGQYVPVPQLNADTGEWENVVRTGDKIVAHFPSAVVAPTPEQKFDQEAAYASKLVDRYGNKLVEVARDPQGREALMTGLRNPAVMQALGQKLGIQNLGRKLELLYAHTSLGDVILPDERLRQARADVLRTREQIKAKTARRDSTPSEFSRVFNFITDSAQQAATMRAGANQ